MKSNARCSRSMIGIVASTALVAGGTMFSSPTTARAAYERHHPVSCTVRYDDADYFRYEALSGFVVRGGFARLGCPLPDTSELPKRDIESIDVYTHDGTGQGNNYVRVSVCAIDRDSTSAACLAGQDAGGSGYKKLTLSTSQELGWIQSTHRDDHYAMLDVYMLASSTTHQQRLLGYTVGS